MKGIKVSDKLSRAHNLEYSHSSRSEKFQKTNKFLDVCGKEQRYQKSQKLNICMEKEEKRN